MKMLRITRCPDSSMWYAGLVGQLVPLEWEWPEGWASREPAGYINLVHFDDAEVEEVELAERRACNACGWAGQQSETVMLGGIGPLCPMCRETTDAQGEEARGSSHMREKSADYIPIPDPDQSDLDSACKVMKLLANMSYGYYPSNEQGAPTFFDGDNVEHLRALHRLIFDIAKNCHGVTRVMCADGILMTKGKDLVRPSDQDECRSEPIGFISDDALRDLLAREPGAPPIFSTASERNYIPLYVEPQPPKGGDCMKGAAMSATKFDPMRLPEPDALGFFMHPDLPGEHESDDVAALLAAMGFTSSVVSFDSDGDEDDVHAWWFSNDGLTNEDMKSIVDRWTPTHPSGDGWVLAGKFDCDDGPHALFVRPVQPPKNEDQPHDRQP